MHHLLKRCDLLPDFRRSRLKGLLELPLLVITQSFQGVECRMLRHVFLVAWIGHDRTPSPCGARTSRSLIMPSLIRVFTVPNGSCSRSAISL